LKLNNVLLLLHMVSATVDGHIAMGKQVIINIKTCSDGHTLPNRAIEAML